MSVPLTPSELDQAEVLASQRREWKAERVGWGIMALILALGALGGFGGGPLAHASRSSGSTEFAFDRLVRHGVPTELRLTVSPSAIVGDRITVSLDWAYLQGIDFRDVRPTPISSTSVEDQLIFEFSASAGKTGDIVFEIEPRDIGKQSGRIGISDGTTLEFEQIVFP